MNKFNILHLTDWHLNDPEAIEEKLRSGFFRDYINGLHRKITASGISKIDLLICTGDFVDKGLTKNFKHAQDVLDFALHKFSIAPSALYMNIGNHDIDVSGFKAGNKNEFILFEKNYSRDYKKVCGNNIYDLFELPKKIYLLKLDSVFNETGEINNDPTHSKIIYPSVLNDKSIDEIVTNIELHIKEESLLIITSHFPMIVNDRMTMIIEDDKWVKKHLWGSGMKMIKRIIENRIDKNILCLYGDGHLDNYWSYNNKHHFFMTGMFGGNYLTNHYVLNGQIRTYHKTNDAKVIQYDLNDFANPTIYNFSYLPEGYDYSAQTGEWKFVQDAIRVENSKTIIYPTTSVSGHSSVPEQEKKEHIECISQVVQDKILDEIRFKDLFSISRTVTSEKESSLGWVSISNLFQNHELFCLSIEKMREWIINNGIEVGENTILCGLGFWGAVFSTQLGARTGIRSYCISSKRIRSSTNYFESINYIKDEINGKNFKNIVLVTDVISTGNSILILKEELSNILSTKQTKWFSLSVLSDKTQERLRNINEFEKIGSLCISLPIPVVDNDKLPDESIFPITFDFR